MSRFVRFSLAVEPLSRELMRFLRGDTPQRQFSRALGFTSNAAYTWEAGRRFPEASVFLRAAELRVPQFRRSLFEVLGVDRSKRMPARVGTPGAVHQLARHLKGETPIGELAAQVGVDRTTLGRWLRGATEPRLPEFLRLVQVGTQRLLALVALIVDPEQLDSTRAEHRDLLLQQKLAYDMPWSHALLRALELESYRALPKHEPGHLAQAVGVPLDTVVSTLDALREAGQIRHDGTRWVNARVMTVDTRTNPEGNRQLKKHWATVGLERLQEPATSPEALFSFNLFAVDEAAFQRIRQLQLDYYDRVRAIVDEAPGTDRVVLMNLQLIPLELPSSSK